MKYFLSLSACCLLAGALRAGEPIADRPSSWAQPVELDGVPNLHRVSENLYRSAQPTQRGMRNLKELGIETVVNLRSFHSDRDEIGDTGLGYEHIYMKAWHPERKEVVRFLQLVTHPNRSPILVHCQHGADRTGTLCALYRIVIQGWTREEAIREMTGGGFGFHEIWKNLPRWITDLDLESIREDVGIEPRTAPPSEGDRFTILEVETPRILGKAARYLGEVPRTVTADACDRSAGGPHDFYSEGDYWWPDPEDSQGPYVRRDGQTNPENFIAHRRAMIHLSDVIGTLTSAYLITQDERYAAQAVRHLRAWFVDQDTRMNPSLLYGQAITGRHTGRSIGLIDTIHLVEVARGAKLLCEADAFSPEDQAAVKAWFHEYLTWINTHEYGIKEKHHPNNHGVCWSLQAAAFADLLGDQEVLAWIREQFATVYLAEMMGANGGFPAELGRTKPYGYSLFIMDAMAGVAQIASTPDDDLWSCRLPDGRSMKKGMEFIVPYIEDKTRWPWKPDVMYWDEWPVRHPSLVFAGVKFSNPDYLAIWRRLDPDPETFEVLRNLPLRHPLLWVRDGDPAHTGRPVHP